MSNHSKPMAISTITSQAIGSPLRSFEVPPSLICSSSSSSNSPNSASPYASSAGSSSTPNSPERSHPFYRQRSTSGETIRTTVIPTASLSCPIQHHLHRATDVPSPYYAQKAMTTKATSPISLDERRQRNKSASAKYRAKKNQKYIEMRTLIASLTKENELLMRQLDNVRDENAKLKSTCDRLRGKMLAEKMLKRFLGNEKPIDISGDEEHESGKKGCLLHFQADTVYEQHLLHNFDNDLDDILEDDTCKQQELEWKPHLYMKKVDSQYEANPDNKVPGKS